MNWIRRHRPTGTVVCQASNPKNLHSKYGEELGLTDEYEDMQADFKAPCGDKLIAGKSVECLAQRPKEPPQPPSLEDRVKELEAKLASVEGRSNG